MSSLCCLAPSVTIQNLVLLLALPVDAVAPNSKEKGGYTHKRIHHVVTVTSSDDTPTTPTHLRGAGLSQTAKLFPAGHSRLLRISHTGWATLIPHQRFTCGFQLHGYCVPVKHMRTYNGCGSHPPTVRVGGHTARHLTHRAQVTLVCCSPPEPKMSNLRNVGNCRFCLQV